MTRSFIVGAQHFTPFAGFAAQVDRSSFHRLRTVAEIEAAIKQLPPSERERLAEDLLSILPELRGDLVWHRIINDERPRPALSTLGDQIEAQFKADPGQFPESKIATLTNADFVSRVRCR